MGLTAAASLNGTRVTSARVNLPAWGAWYADLATDGEVRIAGRADIVIADLRLRGTVLRGGPAKGRSMFRVVGGAGGWGRPIAAKAYANDAGVKASTVLNDAATGAKETIDPATMAAAGDRLGPAWARRKGPASWALERIVPGRWYVGEDGVTRIGSRPAGKLPPGVTHGPVDRARGTVTLAAESIATILPGVVVDGMTAVDVLHEVDAKTGLRSTVWGAAAEATTRRLAAWRAILDQLDPDRAFRAVWEYRVVTLAGARLNLQPVRVSTGLPSLERVPVRPGVAGMKSTLAPGARVLVAFVDADPARPFVCGHEDADGEGFAPLLTEIKASTFLKLQGGVRPLAATGDFAGPFPIAGTVVKVLG